MDRAFELSDAARRFVARELESLTGQLLEIVHYQLQDAGIEGEVASSIVCAVTDARSVSVFWAEQLSLEEARRIIGLLVQRAKGRESASDLVKELYARKVEAEIYELTEEAAERRQSAVKWWEKLLEILRGAAPA